ncbi:hypothetical protein [Microbacterium sp. K24]|uniref:hypothetical protein n=1 Tax=Microbacterium sp. K24 TaxID=2305446 RepID=UPI00109CD491|nr:hypothetical protein [Microbacterium sp. K24]
MSDERSDNSEEMPAPRINEIDDAGKRLPSAPNQVEPHNLETWRRLLAIATVVADKQVPAETASLVTDVMDVTTWDQPEHTKIFAAGELVAAMISAWAKESNRTPAEIIARLRDNWGI